MSNEAPDVLIAPHEIRELLTRLTERSVEGIRFDEPRTLAGLALETGVPAARLRSMLNEMQGRTRRNTVLAGALAAIVVAVSWIGLTKSRRPDPAFAPAGPASNAPITEPQIFPLSGLVSVREVTYGPESGTQMADTTFVPPHPMPEGLGIYATIGSIIWGAGDPHVRSLQSPLDKATLREVREDVVAVLRYARSRATKAGAKPLKMVGGDSYYPTSLIGNSYSGSWSSSVSLPTPGSSPDSAVDSIVGKAADEFVERVQGMLSERRKNLEENGPQ